MKTQKLPLFVLTLLFCSSIYAQAEREAQSGLTELANSSFLTRGMASSALYIGGAILAIGLIGLIYAIATNQSYARKYIISWFVAVFFYMLLLTF